MTMRQLAALIEQEAPKKDKQNASNGAANGTLLDLSLLAGMKVG